MSNPWTNKNPFLSIWLSSANAVAGAARGRATAEFNRQVRATSSAVATALVKVAATPHKPAKRKRRQPPE